MTALEFPFLSSFVIEKTTTTTTTVTTATATNATVTVMAAAASTAITVLSDPVCHYRIISGLVFLSLNHQCQNTEQVVSLMSIAASEEPI